MSQSLSASCFRGKSPELAATRPRLRVRPLEAMLSHLIGHSRRCSDQRFAGRTQCLEVGSRGPHFLAGCLSGPLSVARGHPCLCGPPHLQASYTATNRSRVPRGGQMALSVTGNRAISPSASTSLPPQVSSAPPPQYMGSNHLASSQPPVRGQAATTRHLTFCPGFLAVPLSPHLPVIQSPYCIQNGFSKSPI